MLIGLRGLKGIIGTGIVISSVMFVRVGHTQGTRADYERADALQRLTQGKVIHGVVKPMWIGETGRFWYRDDLGGGKRAYILVDPSVPSRLPAFDAGRMALALGKVLNRDISADRLPIDLLDFQGVPTGSVRVQIGGKSFLCDLMSYALTPDPAGLIRLQAFPPNGSPRASVRTGDETAITFVNNLTVAVDLVWRDPDGFEHPYGILAPGAEREMHTFSGHVWLVRTHDGAKPIAVFVGEDHAGTAVIDTTTPAARRADRTQRPRRRRVGGGASPDGKWQAIVRDNNVILRDSAGAESPLTHDGTPADAYREPVFWSPDARHLVVYKTVPAQEHKVYFVESSPKDQKQPKLHFIDYLKPGDRVDLPRPHLFDAASKRAIPIATDLYSNPYDMSEPRWAADSSEFTFVYNQRGHQVLRIVAVNGSTGAARKVVDETSKTFIDYSGKQFAEYLDATDEIVWMSERDGWNHLYLYDSKSGAVKSKITSGDWVVRGVDRVDAAKRQIWFRAGGVFPGQDPYYVHYGRVNFDGAGLTWLTQAEGTHRVEYSPDNRFYVDTYSRVDLPPVSELHRTDTGALVEPLEKADDSPLLATGWKTPERFVAKGRDGLTDIYGVIWRPTNFDPARKYPVIEDIYAGPQDSFVPKAFAPYYGQQQVGEVGFIVVQIDGMGTSNRSKAFHDVCWKNLGDAGFPDRILWMKAAAAKYPYMDITRVGIYGVSAGGQDAARAPMTHGDFYKVAVADSGCHDNQMDKIWWNEQWMGWPIGPEYDASSNVVAAKNLSGKLMLIVGEMDTNVDPASTMQVVDALIKADKDFDLLVVPGAGHGAGESPYGRRRRADFFVRHLLGVEPRADGVATPVAVR